MCRENGIFGPDKRRRFHRLSEGEYSPARTRVLLRNHKINLVIGNANVFCM